MRWLHGSKGTAEGGGIGLATETTIVIGMDPATGNILTEDEIEMLGKRMEDMIPLSSDVASQLIAERREQAMDLAERTDPGELSKSSLEDMAPVDPRQLIAERQEATIRFAERQIEEQEKARRRKKNKAARRARKNNR